MGFPSASSIEARGDGTFWVIGDDASELIAIDSAGSVQERWPLSLDHSLKKRASKAEKRDFEAMALVPETRGRRLLIFGSGSKMPQRCYVVMGSWDSGAFRLKEYHAPVFYAWLAIHAGVEQAQLNLEGATVVDNRLLMANRENNCLLSMDLDSAIAAIQSDSPKEMMSVDSRTVSLGSIKGYPAGLSGLSTDPEGWVLFSASVEARSNSQQDGAILGSIVGRLRWEAGPVAVSAYAIGDNEGRSLPLKVEGLVPGSKGRLLAVTDNDAGGSEILNIECPMDTLPK